MLYHIGYYNIGLTSPYIYTDTIPYEARYKLRGNISKELWSFLAQHADEVLEKRDDLAHWGITVRVYARVDSESSALLLKIAFPKVKPVEVIPD